MNPTGHGVAQQARLFRALGDRTRLTVIRELCVRGEACAGVLVGCCGVTQPTVSHHLKVLREAGLIRPQRQGRLIRYRLEPDVAAELRSLLESIAQGFPAPVSP